MVVIISIATLPTPRDLRRGMLPPLCDLTQVSDKLASNTDPLPCAAGATLLPSGADGSVVPQLRHLVFSGERNAQ